MKNKISIQNIDILVTTKRQKNISFMITKKPIAIKSTPQKH